MLIKSVVYKTNNKIITKKSAYIDNLKVCDTIWCRGLIKPLLVQANLEKVRRKGGCDN